MPFWQVYCIGAIKSPRGVSGTVGPRGPPAFLKGVSPLGDLVQRRHWKASAQGGIAICYPYVPCLPTAPCSHPTGHHPSQAPPKGSLI